MKKAEFLARMDALANQLAGSLFAGEIWIGRATRDRLSTQSNMSRDELIADLKAQLEKHKDHPKIPGRISKALEQLGE